MPEHPALVRQRVLADVIEYHGGESNDAEPIVLGAGQWALVQCRPTDAKTRRLTLHDALDSALDRATHEVEWHPLLLVNLNNGIVYRTETRVVRGGKKRKRLGRAR